MYSKALKNDSPDHDVRTVEDVGLNLLKNGDLLRAAIADTFEVIITVDRKMPFQQNVSEINLVPIVLVSKPCR